jgi:hypothetical protein
VRRTLRIGVGISSVLLVIASTFSPTQAAAPKPGTACKTLGQKIVSGTLTYTCTKSGSKLIWSKGYKLPLRVITKTFPAAISGRPYRAAVEVTGGTGYHFCNLQKGSGLPPGYSLNPKTCIITGTGEILPAGTTQRVSPAFVIIVTDSASPKPAAIRLTSSIVTYPQPAILTIVPNPVPCVVGKNCNSLIATVSGQNPPYSLKIGTGGFPPLGLFLNQVVNSTYITGTARVPNKGEQFEICAVDTGGRAVCKKASIIVEPAPTSVLKIVMSGDGKGKVVSEPGNIFCGTQCQDTFDTDTRVTLWALPDDGTMFSGWSGECIGSDTCILTVDTDKVMTATFVLSATGTYSGISIWPNQNLPGRTGCEGGPRTTTFVIVEEDNGVITGRSGINFSGYRKSNTMTITADTGKYGLRGPFVWQWDGTTLIGSLPAFCTDDATGALVGESTYTFNLKLTS